MRTPLQVIVGTQDLLTDGFYGNFNEKQREGLELIRRNIYELVNLTNETLDLARLEAGVPLSIEEFDIIEVIDALKASFIPLSKDKGLSFQVNIDGVIPNLWSDKQKLKEILQNLLSNALKYTDRGEVEMRVYLAKDGVDRRQQVVVAVRDTGIGMKSEDQRRLFEPFYMVAGLDRKKYPGTGLGLSIANRIVEMLLGEIRIESEWGKGSTCTVILPLVHQPDLALACDDCLRWR
jgi:signal transduction histidine kinase